MKLASGHTRELVNLTSSCWDMSLCVKLKSLWKKGPKIEHLFCDIWRTRFLSESYSQRSSYKHTLCSLWAWQMVTLWRPVKILSARHYLWVQQASENRVVACDTLCPPSYTTIGLSRNDSLHGRLTLWVIFSSGLSFLSQCITVAAILSAISLSEPNLNCVQKLGPMSRATIVAITAYLVDISN